MHKFLSRGLSLELQVSNLGLGVFDEVSVSSRNFNQVAVSASKDMASITSQLKMLVKIKTLARKQLSHSAWLAILTCYWLAILTC